MLRIAVLASGGGTGLQSILDACESGQIDGKVVLVISNNKDAYALNRAREYEAKAIFIDHRGKTRDAHETEIVRELEAMKIDLTILAGYLRMFTKYFVDKYKNQIINIHPALLPKYGGKGMHGLKVHRAVLDSNEQVSGCSVHFVTEGVDEGPVIARMKVPVKPEDTVETLRERVLAAEHLLLPMVVQWFAQGKVYAENWVPVDMPMT
ncbi:MAG: phosphoribosylglycinamide formyltransferase [Candidatus Thermoplasmatota archaeon]|nr:phosphoribosylglycinamide formyltransferase [Euryarchaeota archaeon]MBU4032243.1 phosphoribosylglycinamide formyltransferase [Candidatus Thermoplasmatota archaeon]MBU4144424.1 phosphoribosylglycinamide formyltransferase [Candidatus Thermoplasmatota archaeon]MBU4591084.1 phosphoribosylglycinamide formyltransferase [Candidatus Thermoplasmatota archaeon]